MPRNETAEAIASRKDPFVPPVFIVNTALRLRRFLLRLADSVVPSYLALYDRFMGAAHTQLVHMAARMRLADQLKDGPLTSAELARRKGKDPVVMQRVMEALTAIHIFQALPDGRFANNKTSRGMLTGVEGGIRGFAEFFGYPQIVRAWGSLPAMLEDGKATFDNVQGRSVWAWLDEEPEARAAFAEGMSSMTEVVVPAIAAAFPFGEVKTVCDVGGGVGIVLAAVLRKHPHLQGILMDSEGMLVEARDYLEAHGVMDRVKCVPGSFFESVPRGADAYILKTVLHNWPDDAVLKILRNVRAAMDPGQHLLLPEFLVTPDPVTTLVPFMDMAGLMIYGGRERSAKDLGVLLSQTGFRMTERSWPLPGRQIVYEALAV